MNTRYNIDKIFMLKLEFFVLNCKNNSLKHFTAFFALKNMYAEYNMSFKTKSLSFLSFLSIAFDRSGSIFDRDRRRILDWIW